MNILMLLFLNFLYKHNRDTCSVENDLFMNLM